MRRASRAPLRAPRRDQLTLFLGCALSVVLTLWLTNGIWAAGIPAGEDTAAHVVRSEYALSHIFSNFQLDGWQTSFGLGYQEFFFAGPGFSFVVAVVKVLSLGTLTTAGAFKVTIVLSYLALPLAVAFLAWAFGLGTRAAGIAAPLTWVVSSGFGGAGLKGVFEGGLVPNQLASTFFCLALGGVVLLVRAPSPRRVVFTAAAIAATFLTHPIAAYVLAFFIVCVVGLSAAEWARGHWTTLRTTVPDLMDQLDEGAAASDDDAAASPDDEATKRLLAALLARPRESVLGLLLAGALAVGLGAFLLVPILAHPELKGENSDWGDLPLVGYLQMMWRGEYVLRPFVLLLVLAGFAYMLWRAWRGQRLALTLVLTPFAYLLIGRLFINLTPDNIVAIQMTNRGIAYVALLALLPLAALIAAPFRPVTALLTLLGFPGRNGDAVRIANAFLPVLFAMLVVVAPPRLGREAVVSVTPTPTFSALADALARNVPEGQRFATQREPAKERAIAGMPHPDLWLAAVTNRDTLNIFNLTSSVVFGPVYEGENLATRTPEAEADILSRLGVSHLVLIDTDVVPGYLTSNRYRPVWQSGKMAILEVVPGAGQPAPAALITSSSLRPLEATTTRDGPERIRITTRTDQHGTASVAVAWSPKWRVAVDGETVPTARTTDNLLQVPLEPGEHTITLDFGPDRADLIGRVVTVLSIAAAIAILVLDRRRRRDASGDTTTDRGDTAATDDPTVELAEADAGLDAGEPEPDESDDPAPAVAQPART
jgi:hypothetical protein